MILLSLLKQNFHPPRALFRLLDTLSHIIIAIKFATKLNTKHKEFLLSFQSISWSSFLSALLKLNVMLYWPVQQYNEPFYFMSFKENGPGRASKL